MINEENHKTRKSGNLIATLSAVLGVLVLVAILGFVIIGMMSDMFQPETLVPVPHLRFTQFTSEEQLGREHPDFRFDVQRAYSAEHEANIIIDQDPLSNRPVPEGTWVVLTVSTGREPVDFIDLSGKSQQEAQTWLTNNGLRFEQSRNILEPHDDVPRLHVISTSPAFGERVVFKGETIILTISQGAVPVTVTMPNLFGNTQEEAESTLELYNLRLGNVTVIQNDAPEGTVVGQSVEAGESVEENTEIDIEISEGPEEGGYPPDTTPDPTASPTPADDPPVSPTPSPTPDPTDNPPELISFRQPIGIPSGIEGTTTLTVELNGVRFFDQEVRADEGTVYVTINGFPDDVVRVWFDGTLTDQRTVAALAQQLMP
jgi:beta-lactam-binding protein with PASTA domain